MSRALVLADLSAITAAKQLCDTVDVLVLFDEAQAEIFAKTAGVDRVLLAKDASVEHRLAESVASLLKDLAAEYDVIIGGANTDGKNILPRLSGMIEWPMISDVIAIKDKQTFVRPIYAGNAYQTVKVNAPKFIMTVRAANIEAETEQQSAAPIETLTQAVDNQQSKFIKLEAVKTARPDLSSAQIIISGGRGLKDKQHFELIERLADKLGAAVGASRAAVDAGWVPNDYQVGQTGKIVAPKLYIAVGISGAIQHLAGMKDAKVIVAINKDPEAPIFKVADYGLVSDLFDAIPELERALDDI